MKIRQYSLLIKAYDRNIYAFHSFEILSLSGRGGGGEL
jgi:hypothetical protein